MLLLVSSVKLVAEIALLAFAGQWLLGLLAGKKREQNLFYKLLQVVTGPFVKGARSTGTCRLWPCCCWRLRGWRPPSPRSACACNRG